MTTTLQWLKQTLNRLTSTITNNTTMNPRKHISEDTANLDPKLRKDLANEIEESMPSISTDSNRVSSATSRTITELSSSSSTPSTDNNNDRNNIYSRSAQPILVDTPMTIMSQEELNQTLDTTKRQLEKMISSEQFLEIRIQSYEKAIQGLYSIMEEEENERQQQEQEQKLDKNQRNVLVQNSNMAGTYEYGCTTAYEYASTTEDDTLIKHDTQNNIKHDSTLHQQQKQRHEKLRNLEKQVQQIQNVQKDIIINIELMRRRLEEYESIQQDMEVKQGECVEFLIASTNLDLMEEEQRQRRLERQQQREQQQQLEERQELVQESMDKNNENVDDLIADGDVELGQRHD